jgi:hypothetical protein
MTLNMAGKDSTANYLWIRLDGRSSHLLAWRDWRAKTFGLVFDLTCRLKFIYIAHHYRTHHGAKALNVDVVDVVVVASERLL